MFKYSLLLVFLVLLTKEQQACSGNCACSHPQSGHVAGGGNACQRNFFFKDLFFSASTFQRYIFVEDFVFTFG